MTASISLLKYDNVTQPNGDTDVIFYIYYRQSCIVKKIAPGIHDKFIFRSETMEFISDVKKSCVCKSCNYIITENLFTTNYVQFRHELYERTRADA